MCVEEDFRIWPQIASSHSLSPGFSGVWPAAKEFVSIFMNFECFGGEDQLFSNF
jgi:hypothetical protein